MDSDESIEMVTGENRKKSAAVGTSSLAEEEE